MDVNPETTAGSAESSKDIRTKKAAEFYCVPESEATPEQRQMMKTITFGELYGRTVNGAEMVEYLERLRK